MNKVEIANILDKFLMDNFNCHFDLPINFNNQLTNVIARVVFLNPHLEIASYISQVDYLNQQALLDVLKHEALHYYLWQRKVAFQDGTDCFESWLKELKLPTTVEDSQPKSSTILLNDDTRRIYINYYLKQS